MSDEKSVKNDNKNGALFIPAGTILGMGIGFATGNVSAGLFIGLGCGFAVFAAISVLRK